MITSPLALPTHTGFAQIEMRATNAVAYSRSPFTFSGQAFAYPGQMWTADITLPPMKRADAEQWVAWLISLRGQLGTFLLGDPTGVTPRGSALGGLVNLLTYSEQFDNAAWTKTQATVTANATTAPDGNTTADKLVEDSTSNFHTINQAAGTIGVVQTYSFYAKAAGRSWIAVQIGNALNAYFDVTNGVLGTVTSGAASISSVGNGWYRCTVTTTRAGNNNNLILLASANGTATYLGNGSSGVYLWGAQLETGSTATTYQPIFNAYGPYVNGASQTGGSLVIDGASPDETGYLLAGDYIQLGTNGSSRLHKVLTNVNTDSSGNATLDIWPHIRVAPADNATVTVSSAKGLFRLSSNEQAWSVNEAAIYGITFSAMEAV